MLSLAFILVFIFCLAIAVAAIVLSHQLHSTYAASFHKFYFYYLVAFYAFSMYGIWGQVLMHVLLAAQELNSTIIERVVNFLPLLGVPFLFVSWLMLVNMTYSLYNSRPNRTWNVVHSVLLLAVIAGSWWTYSLINASPALQASLLKYTEMVVLLIFELFYFIVLGVLFLRSFQKHYLKGANYVFRFWLLLNVGILIRVICLVAASMNHWLLILSIFIYFVSNFVPVMYLQYVSDEVFEPVKAAGANAEKVDYIIKRYRITKREQDIIFKICDGKTNQQIADDLFISLQTVKDHTHRIYTKIGIRSRMQLVQKLNA